MFDTGLMELNAYNIFNENQFSGGDRVMDSNQVTFGIIKPNNGLQRF